MTQILTLATQATQTMIQKLQPHELPNIPLNERPSGCAGCPFGGVRVGHRGPKDSPIVIIGESPGSNELHQGYPFVGDSGELLDATLKKVGLPSDIEPLYLNAMQCFPRSKETSDMVRAGIACRGRLLQEINEFPRKIVLSMGNSAMWSMLGDHSLKVTKERGKLWPSNACAYPVVTTVHPAFLMRQGGFYGKWKLDLQYAVNLLKGKDPREGMWKPPEWRVIENRDDLRALVDRMKEAKEIAGDIETGGANSAGLNHQRGYIICFQITSDLSNGNFVEIIPGQLIWENEDLMHELLGLPAKWIWQNGKFDVKFFRYEGLHEARVDEDTMLLSYAMNENKGHDLDTIAMDWLGAQGHKDVVSEWFAAHNISRAKRDYGMLPRETLLYPYGASDTSKTFHSYRVLREAVNLDIHSRKLYEHILIPASEFLTKMEMKGLSVDLTRLQRTDEYLQGELVAPARAIQEYAMKYQGCEVNIGSPQQLQVLLYNRMKLGPPDSSTDEDHMIKIQRRHDHPIATKILQWRKAAKARNTYVKNVPLWPGVDGRVHVTFKIHGTSTGRLSSGDPTNLQNWPRDPRIRGTFVAAPGKVLVECDLNQAELRCLAIMSADPTLLEIYTRNEVSIHHITSLAMFGEHYTDDEKMRAKAVNFGIVYGRTAPSLAEEFDISVREAEEYIRIWFARYPVAQQFIDSCRAYPAQMRNLITNFGRKKRWGVVSGDMLRSLQNEAANFPHQSSAHDITLLAGIECAPVIKRVWDGDFVNEIHDALYFECDDNPEVYGPTISYVSSVMQRVPVDWGLTKVPFLAEAKVGRRWGGLKNAKDAGITDPVELSEYMAEFKPTADHIAQARMLLA